MNYYIIPAAVIITFIVTIIFSLISKRPFSGLWFFFLIIFLITWASHLWITPFGPITLGLAWGPLFLVSLFFSFLILTIVPPIQLNKKNEAKNEEEGPLIAMGMFFWIIIILLILSIVFRYYKSSNVIIA